jgi:O-antigen ligase
MSADRTGSAQARWEDTKAAVAYVIENPILGAGIGQDILALNEVRGLRWRSVHNVFLQYGVDLGLPGMILFTLVLAYCLQAAYRVEHARFVNGGDVPALAAGVRVSLVAFTAAAFFHPAGYHFYFFYIAGLAVALKLIAANMERLPAPATGDSR